MRILPHHQDTGGFFVAVLEKVKLLPWESCKNNSDTKEANEVSSLEKEGEKDNDKNSASGKRPLNDENKQRGPRSKRRRVKGFREDPFLFFKDDQEDAWLSIK